MNIQTHIPSSELFRIAQPKAGFGRANASNAGSDTLELSSQAFAAQEQGTTGVADSLPGLAQSGTDGLEGGRGSSTPGSDEEAGDLVVDDPAAKSITGETLSDEDHKKVDALRERDREVRTHEQAHAAAGGSHIRGGITFEYETGPDGRRYAVGGEVSIDTSPVSGDPQKTILKAQQVRRAALAPAEPSAPDRQAAAAASRMEAEARQELIEERANPEEGEDIGAEGAPVVAESVSGDSPASEPDTVDREARSADGQEVNRRSDGGGHADTAHPELRAIDTSNEGSVPEIHSPAPAPPELDSSGLSERIQDIRDRAESGGGTAAASVVSLTYGTEPSRVGGLVDLVT